MGVTKESEDRSRYEMHQIAPGVWGREIPPEERVLKPEQVEKLIKDIGAGTALGEWIRGIYFPKPSALTRIKDSASKLFSLSSPK